MIKSTLKMYQITFYSMSMHNYLFMRFSPTFKFFFFIFLILEGKLNWSQVKINYFPEEI